MLVNYTNRKLQRLWILMVLCAQFFVFPVAGARLSHISELNDVSAGAQVEFWDKVVSRVLDSYLFHIQELDRSAGVRVEDSSGSDITEGDVVGVTGIVETAYGSERCINCISVYNAGSSTTPRPLGANSKSLLGNGLPTTGLLVRTWGSVVSNGVDISSGRPFMWLTDGEKARAKVYPLSGSTHLDPQSIAATSGCSGSGVIDGEVTPVLYENDDISQLATESQAGYADYSFQYYTGPGWNWSRPISNVAFVAMGGSNGSFDQLEISVRKTALTGIGSTSKWEIGSGQFTSFNWQIPVSGSTAVITIDGFFDDWSDITPVTPTGNYMVNQNPIVSAWTAQDAVNYYFCLKFRDAIVLSGPWDLYFYINSKGTAGTGYLPTGGIGGDYLLQNLVVTPITTEERIDALLSKMTIEEKAGQANQSGFGPYEQYIKSSTGLGHLVLQLGGGMMSTQAAEQANRLQKMAKEQTRLGIPLLIGCDGILDARAADSVTFPQQIGMGSTWDPGLVRNAYSVISHELRAIGYGRTYTPNVGIARDPRFGRTGECYSEDTYLTSQMAAAAVEGLKGDSLTTGIMATPKHYAAYDATIGGKDSSAMDVSGRALREAWLPPFKAAVDAGAGSIMCAYHAINGVPCAANRLLLTDILKNEWGFDGFVVTDFMCIDNLFNSPQHVANTFNDAIKLGYESGVDVHDHDMGGDFASQLAALVRSGQLSQSVLDEAVRRTLLAKFKLGLFDNPYVDASKAAGIVGCQDHINVSLQMARESMVLLKNSRNLLPISKNIGSIAVIGPNADSLANQCGVWVKDPTGYTSRMVTVLQGIRNAVSPATQINYAKGCDITYGTQSMADIPMQTAGGQAGWQAEYFNNRDLTGTPVLTRVDSKIDFEWGNGSPDPLVNEDYFSARWTGRFTASNSGVYKFSLTVDDGVRLYINDTLIMDAWQDHVGTTVASVNMEAGRSYDLCIEYHESAVGANIHLALDTPVSADADIAEAVAAARNSDMAIVVVGDCPELNAETHDRADLNLTGYQNELVKSIYETGVPTVVVLINARPLTISYIAENVPAIVEAWNPGEQGGTAVAEVLFGDYNPGGKLPITFPYSVGQLPVYYNQEPGWHGGTYCDGTPSAPLYPFGYGLSYTKFQYSNLRLSQTSMPVNGSVQVSVDVQNVGSRTGDEVVQMYIRDPVASVVRPVKELKGFRRISLAPGEKKIVTLTLTADQLAFYNRDMTRVVEPGIIEVMVGGSSVELQTVSLTVQLMPGFAGNLEDVDLLFGLISHYGFRSWK